MTKTKSIYGLMTDKDVLVLKSTDKHELETLCYLYNRAGKFGGKLTVAYMGRA